MGSYIEQINDVVDAVITRIKNNSEILLSPVVVERYDKPIVVADTVSKLPIWYVMPMIKGDPIHIPMDDATSLHNFPIMLEGYYWFESNKNDVEDLRYARNLLFILAEKFNGSGSRVGEGHIHDLSATQSVFLIGDKIVHRLNIDLKITMYN